jgi:hypothetical protein
MASLLSISPALMERCRATRVSRLAVGLPPSGRHRHLHRCRPGHRTTDQ